MLVLSIVLAIAAAIIDHLIGIREPWRKLIYIGCVILFVLGLVFLFVPGLGPSWRWP